MMSAKIFDSLLPLPYYSLLGNSLIILGHSCFFVCLCCYFPIFFFLLINSYDVIREKDFIEITIKVESGCR